MADLRKLPLHLNKILYQFLAYRKAKQLQKEHHFSILWAMMAHATGVPAGLFKKAFPEVKYVLTLQEGDPPAQIEHKMRIFGNAFKRAFTDADTIQVISHFLGQWAKHMGYKREVIRIPNAVNIAHFSQTVSPAEKERVRQELQLAPDDIALVTTSRLVHKNGVDAVIRALPLLPEHIKFVIFGLGPDEAKLQALAKELGVAKRVVFYGFIDHALMPTYLKSCQIFIRPSRSEGMGNSFVEAMVAELPVIATQEGGISDFLFDAVRNPEQPTTGWAVDTESPSQIAEAVQHILANQEKTTAVLATARALALKDYDWDLVAKRMHQEVFTL